MWTHCCLLRCSFIFIVILLIPKVRVVGFSVSKRVNLFGLRSSSCSSALRAMSATKAGDDSQPQRTLRVLALHGSEGTGPSFIERMEPLTTKLLDQHNVHLDIMAPTAPFRKGDGFAWWTMPPGVRSFTADEFEGFEESASIVLDSMSTDEFDLVLGHSQGAILLSALLALERIPTHPKIGYILNGVAVPNPFKTELESLKCTTIPPRVLFVLGVNDKINPKETGDTVKHCMEQAGLQVTALYHQGGHSPPVDDDEATNTMIQWILEQSR